MGTSSLRRVFDRAPWRYHLHAGYRKGRQRLALTLVEAAEKLAGSTAAVLEYPFQPAARWGAGRPPHRELMEMFDRDFDKFEAALVRLSNHYPNLARVEADPRPGEPCWINTYWPGLDALLLYGAIADRRPRTYLEIGSGHSTLFARRAIRDHGLDTRIVSIDPHPRQDVSAVCDVVHRVPLQDADLSLFDELTAGDVVLFDGSHTVFMNSDTAVAFLDVMPTLPPGVLAGVHDVFLPWDYPSEWAGRWYGEQYLLGTLLLSRSPDWSIEFPAWYVTQEARLAPLLQGLRDIVADPPGAIGSSLWLERRSGDRDG